MARPTEPPLSIWPGMSMRSTAAGAGRRGRAKGRGRALGGAFGGLGGGLGGEGKKEGSTKLEKLVLEIGIKEPGAKEKIHTRAVLGPSPEGERFRAMPILHAS